MYLMDLTLCYAVSLLYCCSRQRRELVFSEESSSNSIVEHPSFFGYVASQLNPDSPKLL